MKIAFLYYDDFAEFEISLTCLLLHKEDLVFTGLDNKVYRSEEKQKFVIDLVASEINVNEYDAIVIPGGDPSPLYNNEVLSNLLHSFANKGKTIAGICGGSVLMAQMGILEGKKCTGNTCGIFERDEDYKYYRKSIIENKNVVVDGNIITGQGQAYAEFAVEVGKKLGLFKTDKEYEDEMKWVKNIR